MPLVRLHRLKSLICTRLLIAQLIHEAGSCTFSPSPCYSNFDHQKLFIRKILGLIAYRRDFIVFIASSTSIFDNYESIEQMKIIENDFSLYSVPVSLVCLQSMSLQTLIRYIVMFAIMLIRSLCWIQLSY